MVTTLNREFRFPPRGPGRVAVVEPLEPRRFLSAVLPTNLEQYMVELVNRARADPAGEAARFGIDLNEGLPPGTITTAPKQPVAINPYLTDAARKHSQWMIDNDVFGHTGVNGTDPGDRMAAAGYAFTGSWGWGENIAYRSQRPTVPEPVATTAREHQDLFVDAGIDDRGHRTNLLNGVHKEIGAGIVAGDFTGYNALMTDTDFAHVSGDSFLTGVAFADTVTADDFYTPGEGLGGVTIAAARPTDSTPFTTVTWSAGGYTLRLPPGTYTVTATGGGLSGTVTYTGVTITDKNVKRDFRPNEVTPTPTPTPSPTPTPEPTPTPVDPVPLPPTGRIRGKAFDDYNGSGKKDGGEPALAGQTVFLDADDSGTLDPGETSVATLADGTYEFAGLAPGAYRVVVAVPSDWRLTTPASFTAAVGRGTAKGKSFGLTQRAVLTGVLFADDNADGTRQPDESGLRKRKLFLDLDGDGAWQKTEPLAKTDRDGRWTFRGLAPATYVVRVFPRPGYELTAPAAGGNVFTLPPGAIIDAGDLFGEGLIPLT